MVLGQGSQNLEGTSRFSIEAHCDYLVLTQLHGKLAFSFMSFLTSILSLLCMSGGREVRGMGPNEMMRMNIYMSDFLLF